MDKMGSLIHACIKTGAPLGDLKEACEIGDLLRIAQISAQYNIDPILIKEAFPFSGLWDKTKEMFTGKKEESSFKTPPWASEAAKRITDLKYDMTPVVNKLMAGKEAILTKGLSAMRELVPTAIVRYINDILQTVPRGMQMTTDSRRGISFLSKTIEEFDKYMLSQPDVVGKRIQIQLAKAVMNANAGTSVKGPFRADAEKTVKNWTNNDGLAQAIEAKIRSNSIHTVIVKMLQPFSNVLSSDSPAVDPSQVKYEPADIKKLPEYENLAQLASDYTRRIVFAYRSLGYGIRRRRRLPDKRLGKYRKKHFNGPRRADCPYFPR
jgi:hypothetical protein